MMAIFNSLKNDEKYVTMILEQLLECDFYTSFDYSLVCMMIISPEYFVMGNKKLKSNKAL